MDVRAYLSQDSIWVQRSPDSVDSSIEVLIKNMDTEHRRKAARWLLQKAPALLTIVESSINEGTIAGESDLSDVLSLVAQDPRHWIRYTPLFKALTSGLPMRSVIDV